MDARATSASPDPKRGWGYCVRSPGPCNTLAAVAAKRAEAVIPSNPSRTQRLPLGAHLYKARHLMECCFSKLKQFRRVATRYEKTARNYHAVVTIAAIVLWLR